MVIVAQQGECSYRHWTVRLKMVTVAKCKLHIFCHNEKKKKILVMFVERL